MELRLPLHCEECLQDILHTSLSKCYTSRKKWQKRLGELCSMALAIRRAQYLFCILQQGLVNSTGRRFCITNLIKHALQDWMSLLRTLHTTPVPISMLVPHAPHYFAAANASLHGMGGYWLPTTLTSDSQPCIWRHPFSSAVAAHLVSVTNPTGNINNSELELMALVLGHSTQLHYMPPRSYSWVTKGSPTTTGPPAFLLQHLATDCRASNATVNTVFTKGNTNTIADFLSRSFAMSDDAVLQHMNDTYPIQPCWQLATPPCTAASVLNLALSKKVQQKPYPVAEQHPLTPAGPYGLTSVSPCAAAPSSLQWKTQSPSCKYFL